MPIGGVIAYRDAISPNGVGFDISCGVKGARTAIRADDIRADMGRIMDEIARTVVFGIGRTSGQNTDHALFDDPTWRDLPRIGKLKQLAREQLGTVGSGNHYVDILEDEVGWVWVGVHFGSRGLGHRTATGFLNLAAGLDWDARAPGESMDAPAVVLALSGALGQGLPRCDAARRALRLRRARLRGRPGPRYPAHAGRGRGPQPPQLRLARRPTMVSG